MRKIFIIVFILTFISCVGLYKSEEYRIKKIEGNYDFNGARNILFLSKKLGDREKKYEFGYGRVYLKIQIPNYLETPDYTYNNLLIKIKTTREDYYRNKKRIKINDVKYEEPKILKDVVITKKNGEKIIIKNEKFEYSNNSFKGVYIHLPEPLSGPITIELGKVKIGDEIYDVPKIYMQKYRVTESYSLLGDILNESGEEFGPLYHSEGWVDN